ncbi:hypothetical protein C2845_PM05G22630 [Panicum miliaceum]|uniref:Uncharacterized protein n=1 Tax=Panicum miliaceum TaxID=4540 RepID=A0A3L6T6W0_PANMI|nr:hypothetical protein C2845_PM05G22630 [Panicum miliaceum]
MAPLPPAATNGSRSRRPNPPRPSSSSRPASLPAAAAPQAASPSPASASQVIPGSIAAWLSLPPAFMPNWTPPTVHISDLNGTSTGIPESSELGSHVPGGYFQHSSDYSFPEEI